MTAASDAPWPRCPAGLRFVARVALVGLALAAIGILVLVTVLPVVTGGTARTVRSGSMAPAIPQGALVLDRPVPAADLRVGDVVTYGLVTDGRRTRVTHRIVAIDRTVSPALLTLRGDANGSDDAARIPASDVHGRVWLVVPWLGELRERLVQLRWLLLSFVLAGVVTYAVAATAARRGRAA